MKKLIFTFWCLIAFSFIINAQNLVSNPSFEFLDEETNDPTNWSITMPGGSAVVLQDPSKAYSGNNVMKLTSTETSGMQYISTLVEHVAPNTEYTVSLMGYSVVNEGEGYIQGRLWGDQWTEDDTWVGNTWGPTIPFSASSAFNHISYTFTTPANVTKLKIHIEILDGKGIAFVDDVYLGETNSLFTYSKVRDISGSGNTLTWTQPTEGAPEYYKIYQGSTPDFSITPENFIGLTTATTITNDNIVPGTNKYYAVTAVNEAGFDGNPSYYYYVASGVFNPEITLSSISPNPAKTYFNAKVPNASFSDEIVIYNTKGQTIRRTPINNLTTNVSVADLNKGLYVVKIGNEVHKLIVE